MTPCTTCCASALSAPCPFPPPAACANVSYTSPTTKMTYVYSTCGAPAASASAQCQAMGGLLVSWVTEAEQKEVEGHFQAKVGREG
jgi:hypothetical protein